MLARAIQTVTDAYRPLGIGIAWIRAPFPTPDIPTPYLSLLPKTAGEGSMVGLDAPAARDALAHLAHILYRRIGNDQEIGQAFGYVMAHLLKGVLSHDATDRPTLVRADLETARRLAEGASIFTSEEAKAIQPGVALRAR